MMMKTMIKLENVWQAMQKVLPMMAMIMLNFVYTKIHCLNNLLMIMIEIIFRKVSNYMKFCPQDKIDCILQLRYMSQRPAKSSKTYYQYKQIAKMVGLSVSKVQKICAASLRKGSGQRLDNKR